MHKLCLCHAGPRVNSDIVEYNFPEDGDSIDNDLHMGSSESLASIIDGEERSILAELEGIVTKTPPATPKKVCLQSSLLTIAATSAPLGPK